MENISSHITWREATFSLTAERNGIKNIPDMQQLSNMKLLAGKIFEPCRAGLGNRSIHISSFFRCNYLNSLIGGAVNSQHKALNEEAAMDIDNDNNSSGPANREIFFYILKNLEFDQLIWEYGDDKNPGWVHISYSNQKNRHQILRAFNSYPKYRPFELSEEFGL